MATSDSKVRWPFSKEAEGSVQPVTTYTHTTASEGEPYQKLKKQGRYPKTNITAQLLLN